jgi:glycosyltransferase involved in cell wall biosynthesis
MQEKILISVVMPVYNLEQYVVRTLENILQQMNDSIELIIVNDGSTDKTIDKVNMAVEKFKDKNIKIINQKNQGVSKARNIGIENAIGKYIYFLDGDDIVDDLLFDKIKNQGDFDYLIFGFDTVNEKLETLIPFSKKYIYPKNLNQLNVLKWFLLKNFTICIGSAVYKKEIIIKNNLIFGEKYKYGEDISFFIKYLAHVKNIKVIEKSLMFYVMRDGSAIDILKEPNYESLEAYEECHKYLLANNIPKNIARIIQSCLIPGSIVAQNLKYIKNNNPLNYQIPNYIKAKLKKINFYDCVMKKRKRGLVLYISSLLLQIINLNVLKSLIKIAYYDKNR